MMHKIVTLPIMKHNQEHFNPKIKSKANIEPRNKPFVMPWNNQTLQTFHPIHVFTSSNSYFRFVVIVSLNSYDLVFGVETLVSLFELLLVPDELFAFVPFGAGFGCFSAF